MTSHRSPQQDDYRNDERPETEYPEQRSTGQQCGHCPRERPRPSFGLPAASPQGERHHNSGEVGQTNRRQHLEPVDLYQRGQRVCGPAPTD
jgi:hypothetical protein